MQEHRCDPETDDRFTQLPDSPSQQSRVIKRAMRYPANVGVTIHKPGSSVVVNGMEYVFHTSGQWRSQRTSELVDDPMAHAIEQAALDAAAEGGEK